MNAKTVLAYLQHEAPHPLTTPQLCRRLGLPKTAAKSLKRILRQLEKEGKIICIQGKRYGVAERMDLVTGHVQVHPDGYGFLIPEQPEQADVFINPRNLREVQDGDKVIVRVERQKAPGKREGSIVRILERARRQIVGRYEKESKFAYVVPFDPKLTQDIVIQPGRKLKPQPGQLVLVQIVRYPSRHRSPEGKIVKILGDKETPGIETEAVIYNYQLPHQFPPEVLVQAQEYPEQVQPQQYEARRDLRQLMIFTIDGEKARDFDDAVSLYPLPEGGWQLGVHIADVSHYVRRDTPLDREARQRGCSVYFLDRVLPMLPEKLSNELCSLKPHVERLAFSLLMQINPQGEVIGYELVDSIIKSCARLTYSEVRAMLEDEDPDLCRRYARLLPTLRQMNRLAVLLKKRRLEKGGLDFDLPEPEIILDLQGQPQDIIKQERNCAHELIENFMLTANCTVAAHVAKLRLPFIYRIHEKPDPDKLAELADFVKNFGYQLKTGPDISPADLQELMKQIKDTPEETVITINTLRSLKLARYSNKNAGHFGLGMPFYTHFTSPIRRYPDLIVHRLLREYRQKPKLSARQKESREEQLQAIATESSLRERIAEKAERDIIRIKRTQFMQGKLGEEFSSIVCGVSSFGLFIELEGLYVEGLIHVSNMHDDYYHYLEQEQALVGERNGKRYQIGDKLLVQVQRVDLERCQVDFALLKKLQ